MQWTKYKEVDFQFVRDWITFKILHVTFISSKDQVANVFTIPLASNRFLFLHSSLTMSSMLDSWEANKAYNKEEHISAKQ